MKKITKELIIETTQKKAFHAFLNEFNEWWPKEYTWSQDKLKEIRIDAQKNGLCTEIGPHGFRCDWGRVIELIENKEVRLTWQISPKREPIPNPEKASLLKITFTENSGSTTLQFEHLNFENHGAGAEDYREMMDGEYGWDFILGLFKRYCEE